MTIRLGAGERLHRGRRARVPDVLADRQPDAHAADLDQRRRVAGLEVAALVEHAVVRQQDLAVDGADLRRPRARRRSCRWRHRAPGSRPGRRSPSASAASSSQRARAASRKCGFSHRSSAGIARDRLLGEDDELGAGLAGAADPLGDQARVALDVAHGGVHLGERDAQGARLARSSRTVLPLARRSGLQARAPPRPPTIAATTVTR